MSLFGDPRYAYRLNVYDTGDEFVAYTTEAIEQFVESVCPGCVLVTEADGISFYDEGHRVAAAYRIPFLHHREESQ